MKKVHKHLTVEKETEKIIKRIAKEEKRTEGSVVDLAVQQLAKERVKTEKS